MTSRASSIPCKTTEVGASATGDELVQLVYEELRRLARGYLRHEREGHTLQPTALVHEAYLRLSEQHEVVWQSREHFIAIAATMMRRVLVNYAVKRKRDKRSGGLVYLSLAEVDQLHRHDEIDVISLDAALERLGQKFPFEGQVVNLKFFGGLSVPEIATVLSVSTRTVERSWNFAKTWLLRELNG